MNNYKDVSKRKIRFINFRVSDESNEKLKIISSLAGIEKPALYVRKLLYEAIAKYEENK